MISFQGERNFWIAVGAGFLLVGAALVLWAIPAYSRAARTRSNWQQAVAELERLEQSADKLPSRSALLEQADFRKWADSEAARVESFFRDRTALLTASLSGREEPTPYEFKDAYEQAVQDQRGVLTGVRSRMRVESEEDALPTYEWMDGPQLPQPENYDRILQRYWGHVYLYRAFLDADVSLVRTLSVLDPVYVNDLFDGMPFNASLVLAPEDATDLVKRLQRWSRSASQRPVMQVKSLKIVREGDGANCGVLLEGYVLLLREED